MLSPSFDLAQDIQKKTVRPARAGSSLGGSRRVNGSLSLRLRLRPSLRLGERGFCPGGRASGSERTGLSKHEIDLGNSS